MSNNKMYKNYLQKITDFYRRNRRLPSYREMLKITGLKSTNAIHKIVEKLISEGVLKKDDQGKLSPTRKIFGEIKVLGMVEAGFPSPAEEELIDTMTLDEYLIKNREATYMLEARGDSMIDAGIMPGDLVLVERGPEPKPGDIVIAEVDGKWTMKYFRKMGKRAFLAPANKKYQPIFPEEELNIAAIVRAVIRKYGK
jgi:repressor LexA